jgi:site-specific recombinase XerD
VTEVHEVQKKLFMQIIQLNYLEHRGKAWIQVACPYDASFNQLMKKTGGIYTRTHRSWLFNCERKAYEKLVTVLKGHYSTDISPLKEKLEARKNRSSIPAPVHIANRGKAAGISPQAVKKPENNLKIFARIDSINKNVLPRMQQQLELKAYSPSTLRTYLNEMAQLLQKLGEKPADELKPEHLKRYFAYCYTQLGLSENTLHSRMNAIKFYYEQVLGREKFFWEIPRPKKQILLPKLLNEKELGKIFNALNNKKHKAMLFTAYSAGLRVSEIVNLKIKDIDSGRMQIFIARAKGKKDRYVNLSPVLLDILRGYIKNYKPRPKVYLFESEVTGEAYPVRTVQQIFSNAKRKAGISKEVGIHSLRHSFATHLLEKGVDIRFIKDLLGHFDIKTTERYLHVARQKLVNIISPLDDLFEKEKIDW